MYISCLKLWNFRKFWSIEPIDLDKPNLVVNFNKWLNLLVWPNDAGKTAIIDALKLVLKTHSSDWIKLEEDDFYHNWTTNATELRIEVYVDDKFEDEGQSALWASNFPEWLWIENWKPRLKLILQTQLWDDGKVKPYDIKAWNDDIWYILTADAKDLLRCVYLKPLRDAENELIPKKWSRLSQILWWHEKFKWAIKDNDHELVKWLDDFNKILKEYFADATKWSEISKAIEKYLESFHGEYQQTPFTVNDPNLKSILELLKIAYEDKKKWLGSQNLLFIATELLHLSSLKDNSLKLALIEEVEAHLHPQNQMRVVESLQKQAKEEQIQMIFTTHSPNISSKIKLENLILSTEEWVFSMWSEYTKLDSTDYNFLERFLDVTKANLFFANGVILVEWWWEELLLPVLAKKLWIMEWKGEEYYDFTRNWVSIVNVWSTAYMRYAKVFGRVSREWEWWETEAIALDLWINVSVINDLDVKPDVIDVQVRDNKRMSTHAIVEKQKKELAITEIWSENIKPFISPIWTLEYCIATSEILKPLLIEAMIEAQKEEKLYDYESWALQNVNELLDNLDHTKFNCSPEQVYAQISKWEKITYTDDWNEKSLYAQKISKAIVAQQFATILENQSNEFRMNLKTEIENTGETHWILYILNAIKHACGETI